MTTRAGTGRIPEAAAWAALIVLGLAAARNAAGGTLGAWLGAKFLNRGAPAAGDLPGPAGTTAAAVGLAPTTGKVIGRTGPGRLADPLPSGSTGDGFGAPRSGGTRTHKGIDLIAPAGTPIYAAEAGRIRTFTLSLCGVGATIDHGGGLSTNYCHISRYAVRSGATVRRGQVIAYVGNTGNSAGPHLHFEVEQGGVDVDPAPWIGR